MEETEIFNPFWHGGAAALLLCAIAVSMYFFVTKPATEDALKVYQQVEGTRQRLRDKEEKLHKLKLKCAELESGDPQTMSETIRQELLLGNKGEYVLSDRDGKKTVKDNNPGN